MTSKDHSGLKEGEGKADIILKIIQNYNNWTTSENYDNEDIEDFCRTQVELLKAEPKEQVSNWKERFSEEYAICSGESSDLIKWIEENLINQKVPQVSNTDWKPFDKMPSDFDTAAKYFSHGYVHYLAYAKELYNRVQPVEQQLREAKQEVDEYSRNLKNAIDIGHRNLKAGLEYKIELLNLKSENERLRNLLAEAEQK